MIRRRDKDEEETEDDLCPSDECVVRTDLVDNVESPPFFCEGCHRPDCEWEPDKMYCPGVHHRYKECAVELKKYYFRNLRRNQRKNRD